VHCSFALILVLATVFFDMLAAWSSLLWSDMFIIGTLTAFTGSVVVALGAIFCLAMAHTRKTNTRALTVLLFSVFAFGILALSSRASGGFGPDFFTLFSFGKDNIGGGMLAFLCYCGYGLAIGTWVPVTVAGLDFAFHRYRQMVVLTAVILILSEESSFIALVSSDVRAH
jgi:hypothetical protein